MKKRRIGMFLVFAAALAVSACGGKAEDKGEAKAEVKTEAKAEAKPETKAEAKPEAKAEEKTESKAENAEASPYDYTPGVLNTVVDQDGKPAVRDFHIEGLQILSDAYGEEWDAFLADPVFKTEGIKSELKDGGYIGILADLGDKEWEEGSPYLESLNEDLRIVVAPHKTLEEYEEMDFEAMEAYWAQAAEEGSGNDWCGVSGEGAPKLADFLIYADEGEAVGTKDILFVWKNKIAQAVVVDVLSDEEYSAGGYDNGYTPAEEPEEEEAAEEEPEEEEAAEEEPEEEEPAEEEIEEESDEAELSGEVREGLFDAFLDASGSDGDTWPDAGMWESIGLPALDYADSGENVSLFNFGDSLTVQGWADNETLADTLESLAGMLTDAGLDVEKRSTLGGTEEYVCDYTFDGMPLQLRMGSGSTAQVNINVSVQQ